MGRRFRDRQPISVTLVDGQPTAFTWRGCIYQVRVIGTWRLATRWWEADEAGGGEGEAVDREYYRVLTPYHQPFDIYHDVLAGGWVLDVCHD